MGKALARLRIREVAEAKGFSMGLLSRKANVTLAVIRKVWRDAHHDISFRTLEKIAAALEVPVSSLIENGDESPPPPEQ
jgi:transcriptional regulator with XRE-family HTH domain